MSAFLSVSLLIYWSVWLCTGFHMCLSVVRASCILHCNTVEVSFFFDAMLNDLHHCAVKGGMHNRECLNCPVKIMSFLLYLSAF